ncbi:hypothetical protein AU198_04280 [Mycobacterium sp. GA-1199]|nr:hypothetical protein AU198_04280 [Mycobacterium sp. GA-1199]
MGPPLDDILNDPNRINTTITGLEVQSRLEYILKEEFDETSGVYHDIYTITVTNPDDNQFNAGDIYVLQVVNGEVQVAAKLPAGSSFGGVTVFDAAYDLTCIPRVSCGVSTVGSVHVVAFPPGKFPDDLIPPGDASEPYPGYFPEAEEGIKDSLASRHNVACLLPGLTAGGEMVVSVGGPKGKGFQGTLVGAVKKGSSEAAQYPIDDDVDQARQDLIRECVQGCGSD